MASDVDIILEVAVNGVNKVNDLSNAVKQLNKFTENAINPIKALDARSRALNIAVGATNRSLNNHAKTVKQLATNQAILSNEIARVSKEIKGLGTSYNFATGASRKFQAAGIQGLKAYNTELKKIKFRALISDLKSVSMESKRLGKDMQFVGRSLIIGLTTPIMVGTRQALQGLVALDSEVVRLTKVLEGVAPTADIARQKLGEMADEKQVKDLVDSFNQLEKTLTTTSQKFGIARSLAVGLAADFAELGITQTDNIAKLTELTAVAEKLGNMDISNAQNLVQSLYFQAVRTLSLSQPRLSAIEREKKAIASATAQLQLFNQVENVTALTLRDLGDAFPEVAAAATSFGLSMTEAGALLAPMKAAGFEIGASANSIKVSLQRVTAPTKQNADLLNRLSREYGAHFKEIKGSGLDALQALSDAYNDVAKSAAGTEGAQEMFARLFGVRQGPRMETAIQQLALFDSILKDTSSGSAQLAEKQIQNIANSVISASDATLPLINNFRDIGILARIATASVDPRTMKAEVEGFGEVTQSQINAAKRARIEIGKEMAKVTQEATIQAVKAGKKAPGDLISQIGTETGRALMIQLAGPYTAAQLANQELERALGSLDVQLSMIRNNFKNFAAELIKALRPAIEKIVEISDKLYTAWTNLAPETKKLISSISLIGLGLAAAIGPLVFITGQARLAFGTISQVIFSFLPSLKTLSIETLAARSAMTRLTNPITVVGETIVNTNSKFATWIATLASGTGPMQRFAEKFGQMSGILQKTTTAPVPLVSALQGVATTKQEGARAGSGFELFGPTGAKKRRRSLDEVEEAMRKRILRESGLGAVSSSVGSPAKLRTGLLKQVIGGAGFAVPTGRLSFGNLYQDLTKQMLTSMGFPAAGGRGPGGRFSRPIADMLSEAETMQAAGVTSRSAGVRGAGGRFRRLTTAERTALQVLEDAQNLAQTLIDDARTMANSVIGEAKTRAESRMAKSKELATKGVDFDPLTGKTKFKGREISDKRSADIYRGGVRGMFARTAEFGGRARESITAKIPKPDLNPINAYRKSVAGASAAMATLNAQTMAATGMAPRRFATASAAAKGFATSTALGTKALKLMKIALISSGIGAILLAVGVAAMIVKNNMETFSKTGKKGFEAIGRVVKILKSIVEELARPFIDLFASFSSGKQGAEGAADGIGKAFNGIAVAIEFVAKMVKWLVTNIIQPYLYGIANIVKFVVNLFQGKWSEALKALGAAFANIFGGIAKMLLTIVGFIIKQVINFFFEIPSAFGKAWAWAVEKGTDILFGFVEWAIKQVKKIPGIGKFLGGVGEGALGAMRKGRDAYVGMVKGIANATNAAGDWMKRGIDTGINAAKKGIDSLAKGGIQKSKGSLKLFDKKKSKKEVEDFGDDAQETISNAMGEGFDEGVEDGLKKAQKHLRELKKELQEEIVSRAKTALEDVVDALTKALQSQKENALKIYDDQIESINSIAKAEERLTEAKEYEIKRRELLDKRELDSTNFRRQRMLAIYEGRIDDARQLALEQVAMEQESDKEVKDLDQSRNKQIADQKREDLIESINKAKEVAAKYFDDMIKGFQEAAKKITEFPPTTAEQFNEQLEELKGIAIEAAESMGTKFTEGITNVLPSLSTKAESPLTTALAAIGKTITDNNPFGTEGVWQKSIDGAIDYLTKKYEGLNGTMTLVFDESSAKFKTLFDTYQKYKKLMDEYETATGGGTGAGGDGAGGTGTGGGQGGTGSPGGADGRTDASGSRGFGATAPRTLREIATKVFKDYYPTYRGSNAPDGIEYIFSIFKDYKTNRAKGYGAALGNFIKNNKDYNVGIKWLAYQAAAKALVSNNSSYSFGKGGKMPFMGSGPTDGPTQQGIPAILHGGEYVVRNSAVKKYGWGMLDKINQGSYNPKSYYKGGILDESRGKTGLKNIKKPSKKSTAQDKIRDAIKNPGKYAGSAKSTFVSHDDPNRQEKLDKIQSDFNKSGFGKAWRTAGFAFNLLSPAGLLPIAYAIGAGKDINTGKKLSAKQRFLFEPGKLALGAAAIIAGVAAGKAAIKGVSKVIPKVGSLFGKKTMVNTVADATSAVSKVAEDVATVKRVTQELDIVRNPTKIDDYIVDSFKHPEGGRLDKYGSDLRYSGIGDEITLLTDQYKIGLERIVFGLDPKFAGRAKLSGIKNVSRNPFEIARVDPMSEAGGEIANIFAQAKLGLNHVLMESGFDATRNTMPTTVEALLYAASRGSVQAKAKLTELASRGRQVMSDVKRNDHLKDVAALRSIENSSYKNIDLEDLYIVHETMFPPVKDALGRLNIKPTADYKTHYPTFKTVREHISELGHNPDDIDYVRRFISQRLEDFETNALTGWTRTGGRFIPSRTGDIRDTILYEYANVYRDSIHTALNHLVTAHEARSQLDEGGKVIVAKLTDVLKANPGALENLYPVDTWFTPKPGQSLIIPKGSFEMFPTGPNARYDVRSYLESQIDMSKFREWEKPLFAGGSHGLEGSELTAQYRIRQLADAIGVTSGKHFESPAYHVSIEEILTDMFITNSHNMASLSPNAIWRAMARYSPTGVRGIITKQNADRFVMSNGGLVPKFASQSVPGLLHGGEFVVNSSAVKNIGLLALEAMNNLRFQKPKVGQNYQSSGYSQPQSTSTVHIYVDNFIGEKAWFESMMKDYNISIAPHNQKNAGLQNRTITTYNGINRGL